MRLASLLLLTLSIASCQSAPRSSASASAPNTIVALSDQKSVYTCPDCGMDYDGPGQCKMCHVALVKTDIAYICPADDRPVDRAGKCPRCDANARVVRTAAAVGTPGATAPAPAGTTTGTSGAANGS